MSSLALPDFSAQDSQALLSAMRPFFEEDGIGLHYFEPTRWLAQSELFSALATASPDRVAGRQVEHWLPTDDKATALRRLHSEMQMLLYNHPLNDDRVAHRLPPVNSFWLSGTGALPAGYRAATGPLPTVLASLRDPALQEDWPAWVAAWEAIDATECAMLAKALDQGSPVRLTLCGERHAQTFGPQQSGVLTRFNGLLRRQPLSTVLERL
jgi:hypothetical protein